MSDLQCPATFVIVPTGRAGETGSPDVGRVAAIFAGSGPEAAAIARRLGATHRLAIAPLDEDGPEGYRRVLGDLSDSYRGETVVVVLDVEHVAELAADGGVRTGPLEVRINADGWAVRSWSPGPQGPIVDG